jgi:hypothetical protein
LAIAVGEFMAPPARDRVAGPGAQASARFSRTLNSPSTSTELIVAILVRAADFVAGSMTRSIFFLTASALKGVPS